MPDEGSPMTPEDALRRMADVTSRTRGLRIRTEGLTIVVFAICIMASYQTLVGPILFKAGPPPDFRLNDPNETGFNASREGRVFCSPDGAQQAACPRPPPTAFFLSRSAPLVWYVVAALVTIAVWRSASLSMQTGLSTPRLVGTFVAWLALFAITVGVLTYVQGGNPRSWHLVAWGVVIGLFALANPLRFSTHGRVATGVIAAVALTMAGYAAVTGMGARDVGFLSGVALGLPGLVTGLWLMFRG